MNTITVSTVVKAPLSLVWECWTLPEHIEAWAFASDDWEAKDAKNDVREGGTFSTTMAAKDGSRSFQFSGVYIDIKEHEYIAYTLEGDGRRVEISFEETPEGVVVRETFEPEEEHSVEVQQAGWQAILDNFKKHTESCKVETGRRLIE